MKKLLVTLLAAALCLTACAGGAPEDAGAPLPEPAPLEPTVSAEPAPISQPLPAQEPEPAPESICAVSEEVTVSLLQDAYPVGTERLTLVLDNAGESELGYGGKFSCERYNGGVWEAVEFSEHIGFADVLYLVQPHSAGTLTLNVGLLAQPLEQGLYRITGTNLRIGTDETSPAWQVSFRVAADASPEPDYILYIPGRQIPSVQGCVVTNRLPVLFINTTGEDGQVVDIPHLERQSSAGVWEEIPYSEGIGFCGTPDRLPAEGREWSEDISTLWGVLEDGHYRLSYAVGRSSGTDQTAYGEFTLYTPENNQGLPLAG